MSGISFVGDDSFDCQEAGCLQGTGGSLAYRCEECGDVFCYDHLFHGYGGGFYCGYCTDAIEKEEWES